MNIHSNIHDGLSRLRKTGFIEGTRTLRPDSFRVKMHAACILFMLACIYHPRTHRFWDRQETVVPDDAPCKSIFSAPKPTGRA